MKRISAFVSGLTAVAVTIGLLFGVPIGLAAWWGIRPATQLLDVFGDPLANDTRKTAAMLTFTLLTAAWIAWAMIAAALIGEIVSQIRGVDIHLPGIPAGVRRAAAHLITTCALLAAPFMSTVATAAPPLQPIASATPPSTFISEPGTAAPMTPVKSVAAKTGTYTVKRGDHWWSLAERLLGSGERWNEIVALNHGRTMPDGTTITEQTPRPQIGWILTVPAEARHRSDDLLEANLPERSVTAAVGGVVAADLESEPLGLRAPEIVTVENGDDLWTLSAAQLRDTRESEPTEDDVVMYLHEVASVNNLAQPNLVVSGQQIVMPDVPDRLSGQVNSAFSRAAPTATAEQGVQIIPVPTDLDSVEVHIVQPGESLWSIADDELGDGHRWNEIYDANVGQVFDDGQQLVDPDLIQPGWDLTIGATEAETPLESDTPRPAPPNTPTATTTSVDPPHELPQRDQMAEVEVGVEATAPEPVPSVPNTTWITPNQPDGGISAASPTSTSVSATMVARQLMLAGGILTLLAVRRRRRLRSTRTRVSFPPPSGAVQATEQSLRVLEPSGRLARLDIAVRSVTMPLIEQGRRIMAVTFTADGHIRVLPDGIALIEAPWSSDGEWLSLSPAIPLELLAPSARQAGAACPTLVELGVDSAGGAVFVDLEACEAIEIEPADGRGDEIVTALTATLATSTLAEVCTIVTVGVDPRATFGHPGVIVANSADEAVQTARAAAGTTTRAGVTTFELRGRGTSGEAWEPAAVLVTSSATPVRLPSDRRGLAIVGSAPLMGPSQRFAPDPEHPGMWRLAPLGLVVDPVRIDVERLEALDDLVCSIDAEPVESLPTFDRDLFDDGDAGGVDNRDSTRTVDRAGEVILVPPSEASNDSLNSVASECEPEPNPNEPRLLNLPSWLDPDLLDSDATLIPGVPLADLPPPAPDDRPDSLGVSAVPTAPGQPLDDDLADNDPSQSVISESDAPVEEGTVFTVRLFGGVEIVGPDGRAVDFKRSKSEELIVWLALHRGLRSTRIGARTALWSESVRDATFANVVSEARRTLARVVEPPAGEEWVGRTLTESLPLHDRVGTDAEIIAAALEQARLQPPEAAIATLQPAVELINGFPFASSPYLWPDAEGITSNLVVLAATLTIELAAHHLSMGNASGVFDATARGLAVIPAHEELIGLRMQAHAMIGDRAGVRAEWESYERAINADPWSDGEPSPKLVVLRGELLAGSSAAG